MAGPDRPGRPVVRPGRALPRAAHPVPVRRCAAAGFVPCRRSGARSARRRHPGARPGSARWCRRSRRPDRRRAGRVRRVPRFVVVEHGLDEGPERREGVAQVLGARRALAVRGDHVLGPAVVLHEVGLRDREVVGAALPVLDRVATLAHDRHQQRVGVLDGTARVVDETPLDLLPVRLQALALVGLQGPELVLVVAVLALAQLLLGLLAVAGLGDAALVLGPELVGELLLPTACGRARGRRRRRPPAAPPQ